MTDAPPTHDEIILAARILEVVEKFRAERGSTSDQPGLRADNRYDSCYWPKGFALALEKLAERMPHAEQQRWTAAIKGE